MARKRMVDPSIWHDPDFGELDFPEQVFFIGCFSNADDEGRLIGDPRHLRAAIFEYKDITVQDVCAIRNSVTDKLRNLVLYRVDGREYLYFRNWYTYQSISHPTASRIPEPPSETEQNISGNVPESIQSESGTNPLQYSIDKFSVDKNSTDAQSPIGENSEAILAELEETTHARLSNTPKELTPAQKRFLEIFDRKMFKPKHQAVIVANLETEFGLPMLEKAFEWAIMKGLGGDLGRIATCCKTMQQNGGAPRIRAPNGTMSEPKDILDYLSPTQIERERFRGNLPP